MREFLVTHLSPKLKLEENTTVNLDNSMSAATMNALIAAQPKDLNGYILTFQFADGTYTLNETLDFSGFRGGGTLRIYGNSSDNSLSTTKSVNLDFYGTAGLDGLNVFDNVGVRSDVFYLKITTNSSSSVYSLYFRNCTWGRAYYNYVTASSAANGFGYTSYASHCTFQNNYITGHWAGFYFTYSSHNMAWANDDSGTLPSRAYYGDGGSRTGYYSTVPAASTTQITENGGSKITS